MKRFWTIWLLLTGLTFTANAHAIGMTLALWITTGGFSLAAATWATYAVAFAINLAVSAVITKALADGSGAQSAQSLGNRQNAPPATDNKLPVVYGSAYVGGQMVDLSITSNNQQMYYVIALSEVTNSNTGQTPDVFTFGNVYWGGRKVLFSSVAGEGYKVTGLLNESTAITDTTVAGKMEFYFYRNGSNTPTNSTKTAIQVMQDANLVYKWDNSKLMTNCAFVIVHLTYSETASIRGMEQPKFQVINPRSAAGDCISDYLINSRYGAALTSDQIDTASIAALNTYGNQTFTYTTYTGTTASIQRFRFDGVVETGRTIMSNLQDMASCCDCLIRYNEVTGKWGVIVQQPNPLVVMTINDYNLVGALQITPTDIASSYNIAEVKFPDSSNQDAFNSVTYDLAVLNPALLYPNEPINKQSIALPFVNNNVRAQYLANRFLEAAREDLQIQCTVTYQGLQLEAGDVVAVTNGNYYWVSKQFRITKVTETYKEDGVVTVTLLLSEFNGEVYDDANIKQFTPSPNTGIGSPYGFGAMTAPTIPAASIKTNAAIPSFGVQVTASSSGITQYAEIWYSAFSTPDDSLGQRIFAGTTKVNSAGNPYAPSSVMETVILDSIPQGNWYFFVRMVNSLATSNFSGGSAPFAWRPMTFQYADRYLAVAYASNATGTAGFTYNPRNKAYFGLYNTPTANGGTNPALYTWYPVTGNNTTGATTFGNALYLLYANRTSRRFSFAVGNAGFNNLGGSFTPSETSVYDIRSWAGLQDPAGTVQSFIDLDATTGQLITAAATSNNQNDGFLNVVNNPDGTARINLQSFLNFGAGIYTKNFNAATLTIDVYGRVVGFQEEDQFFYTETRYSATAGQTVFPVTHTAGWVLVFRNGCLLEAGATMDYTETGSGITMLTACAAGERVTVIYMYGSNATEAWVDTNMNIASISSTVVTYQYLPYFPINAGDKLTFANSAGTAQYTVSSVNTTTKQITFTAAVTTGAANDNIYLYRAAGTNYAPFYRFNVNLTSATSYTPANFAIRNGAESLFWNGMQINEVDYNINDTTGEIYGFPSAGNGRLNIIQYLPNNLNVPASNLVNVAAYSNSGQLSYPLTNNPLSLQLFANGVKLVQTEDFNATTANWTLTTAFDNNVTLLNQQTFGRSGAA